MASGKGMVKEKKKESRGAGDEFQDGLGIVQRNHM